MAYVKPTARLWNQIDAKINSMFEDRLEYATDWANYGMKKADFDRHCLVNIIPPEIDEMIQKLGAAWFTTGDNIQVQIKHGSKTELYPVPAKYGGRKPFVSPHWNHYYSPSNPVITDPEIIKIAEARETAYQKVVQEREAFKEKVAEIWGQAPSVNALVKLWEPIRDLLPAETLKLIDTKTTRRTVRQMKENLDTKALSVHLLKAKVAE